MPSLVEIGYFFSFNLKLQSGDNFRQTHGQPNEWADRQLNGWADRQLNSSEDQTIIICPLTFGAPKQIKMHEAKDKRLVCLTYWGVCLSVPGAPL